MAQIERSSDDFERLRPDPSGCSPTLISLLPLLALLVAGTSWAEPVAPAPPRYADEEDEAYRTVVTASRANERAFESPRAITVLHRSELREAQPATTPEALRDQVGMTMQRTNTAGGAPILRGLLGQHVLLLVDGVRMNNAITRYGPNQLLNTVDPLQIQQVEILRGPGSVFYGSDALGGVVNIITRKPPLNPRRAWDLRGEALGRFDSADRGLLGHVAASGQLRTVALRLGATLKRFDDLSGGRDTGLQRFTGYREGDADLSLAWAISERQMLRLSYATVQQHDAFRTDKSSPQDFRRFSDQLRDLVTLGYSGDFPDSAVVQRADATLSFHLQRELRERFRLDRDRVEREFDRVASLGGQVALHTALPKNALTYGVDLYHDWVGSRAENETIASAEVSELDRGRYVDGSRYLQLGVFISDRVTPLDKLAVDLGGRFSSVWVEAPEDPTAPALGALSANNIGGVGSLHGRYLLGSGLNLVAGVSQGFRAPNVDDYSGLGCSGQGYDVPNTDLSAEKSVTAEAGVKLDLGGLLEGGVFYYFTYLHDVIVRRPVDPAALGITVPPGQCPGVPVTRRENAQSGRIHGVELDLRLNLGARWSLFTWGAWTHGQVVLAEGEAEEPMGRIPPLSGLAGVRLRVPEVRGFVELGLRWAAPQGRLSESDKSDRRICPEGSEGCEGTPGYAVLSLRGAARLADPLTLRLSVENLTNETYRVHGSGVDGAGISAILGLELNLR